MLTSSQKILFRKLLMEHILTDLLNNSQFNPYECENAYLKLSNEKKIQYLSKLEKYFFDKPYEELGYDSVTNFLDIKYNTGFLLNPFKSNVGKKLNTNILDLSSKILLFRVALQKPKMLKSEEGKLHNSFLNFISALYNFYEFEKLL